MIQSNNITLDTTAESKDGTLSPKNQYYKYAFIVLGIIITSLIWTYATNPIVISVSGTGSVTVPATYAISQITMAATGADAGSAITALQSKINNVKTILTNNNVVEENIAQSQPQVTPAALVVAGASGYQATEIISFKTKYITDMPSLVTNLYANGATVVAQPTYLAENQEVAERTAMQEAITKADTESKFFTRSRFKFIRKIVAIQQASSGSTAQSVIKDSQSQNAEIVANGGIKIGQAVQVTYKIW